jgi:hypothetical protein
VFFQGCLFGSPVFIFLSPFVSWGNELNEMTKKQHVERYLAEKGIYDKAGVPEHERSKRFLEDERLAKSFLWQERKNEKLRDKEKAKSNTYTKGFEAFNLQSVMLPSESRRIPVTSLSHWVGDYGPQVPLASWRDPKSTVRILGEKEFQTLSSR